jgi:IS5 family transposase
MRKKTVSQPSLFDQAIEQLMTLIEPEIELQEIDRILDENPAIIDCVHSDLVARKIKTGSKGISAEQILRSAVLKQYKRYTYRELVKRLNDGVILRWFSRFYSAKIPHYTAFQKAIKHISFETWNKINDILLVFSRAKKLENGSSIRVDTTVTECNITYPVDARLLNDSVRILTRWMERSIADVSGFQFSFSNRTRRVKKRCYQIVMAKGPNASYQRKKCYVDLIKVANEVFQTASRCCEKLSESQNLQAPYYHEQLDHFLTLSAVAIDQCERRVLNEEKVPASEKIVSIFEEHTDIIKRGKSGSPTEFGHKVLVASGKSGIITQCKSFRGNPCDGDMVSDILEEHKRQYGRAPRALAGDRRFFSADNEKAAYGSGVRQVSICKPGYRSKARRKIEKERWFKRLQRYRAGIEGLISGLMRGYGLKRCNWRGWQGFKNYVSLSIVTFNLQKIASLL